MTGDEIVAILGGAATILTALAAIITSVLAHSKASAAMRVAIAAKIPARQPGGDGNKESDESWPFT